LPYKELITAKQDFVAAGGDEYYMVTNANRTNSVAKGFAKVMPSRQIHLPKHVKSIFQWGLTCNCHHILGIFSTKRGFSIWVYMSTSNLL